MQALFGLGVAVFGLVFYLVAEGKVSTLGLWTFGAGLLAFLLRVQ